MPIHRINYPFLADPAGPYVHAVKYQNTLYLSGLTAFGTGSQTANIEDQTKEIFSQIDKIASAENSSLDNIIKITAYVTGFERIEHLRRDLFEIYGQHLPASSLIKISGLFSNDLKIEIEAIIAL